MCGLVPGHITAVWIGAGIQSADCGSIIQIKELYYTREAGCLGQENILYVMNRILSISQQTDSIIAGYISGFGFYTYFNPENAPTVTDDRVTLEGSFTTYKEILFAF